MVFLDLARRTGLSTDDSFNVLEVGCGHGILRRQLEKNTKWTIDGVDLNMDGLKHCSSGRGELYFYNIFDRRKEFEGRYDFLILFDVLEHITDRKEFLQACRFHVKKNGFIFINVPALNSLYGAYDRAAGHVLRYDKKTLSKEIADCNFKAFDIRYWGFSLLPFLCMRNLMTLKDADPELIIQKGFKPPHETIHSLFKVMMHSEHAILKSPFLGTSVMAAAQCP